MRRDRWEDKGPYTAKTGWVQVMPLCSEGILQAAEDFDILRVVLGVPHQAAVPSPAHRKQRSTGYYRSAEEVHNLAIAVEGGIAEQVMQLWECHSRSEVALLGTSSYLRDRGLEENQLFLVVQRSNHYVRCARCVLIALMRCH